MARETVSERLVRMANLHYYKLGEARIGKNDPSMRIMNSRVIFNASTGLDFSGLVKGGKHISFEVKQTQKEYLPVGNIRANQMITMEKELRFKGETFFLVWFEKLDEWYRIEFEDLNRAYEGDYPGIPVEYFRAFGFMIPNHQGFPEYLAPEAHPSKNDLIKEFPWYMPKKRVVKRKKPVPLAVDHSDKEARKKRILTAMSRGIKNAGRREIRMAELKERLRDK